MSETHSPVGVITIQRLLPFASWARMGTIGQELTSDYLGDSPLNPLPSRRLLSRRLLSRRLLSVHRNDLQPIG